MHIEPGYVAPAKVLLANAGAVGVLVWGCKEYLKTLIVRPATLARTLLAAGFFSLFMQSFSTPVGPSELHFVGAMVMYLTLGFLPTLIGFGVGLLFQGLIFNPADLYHLGVNSLSLMLPLIAVHYISGRKYFDRKLTKRLSWQRIVQLDGMYYAGVTGMVGFWLSISGAATPFTSWATFAASYLVVVACEPLLTWAILRILKSLEGYTAVRSLTQITRLKLA